MHWRLLLLLLLLLLQQMAVNACRMRLQLRWRLVNSFSGSLRCFRGCELQLVREARRVRLRAVSRCPMLLFGSSWLPQIWLVLPVKLKLLLLLQLRLPGKRKLLIYSPLLLLLPLLPNTGVLWLLRRRQWNCSLTGLRGLGSPRVCRIRLRRDQRWLPHRCVRPGSGGSLAAQLLLPLLPPPLLLPLPGQGRSICLGRG